LETAVNTHFFGLLDEYFGVSGFSDWLLSVRIGFGIDE